MVSENVFLVYALLMGVFINLIYDILRIFRRVVPHCGWLVSIEDFFFWVYCAVEVFLLMHRFSDGILRWFAVLGALTGMLLYKKLFSNFLVNNISDLLCRIKKLLGRVLGWLFAPLWHILAKIRKAFRSMAGRWKSRALRARTGRKKSIKKKLTFFLKILKMTI